MSSSPSYSHIFRPTARVLAICDEICGPLPEYPNRVRRQIMHRGVRVKALRDLCGCSYPKIASLLNFATHYSAMLVIKRELYDAALYRQVMVRVREEMPVDPAVEFQLAIRKQEAGVQPNPIVVLHPCPREEVA